MFHKYYGNISDKIKITFTYRLHRRPMQWSLIRLFPVDLSLTKYIFSSASGFLKLSFVVQSGRSSVEVNERPLRLNNKREILETH